MWHGTWVPVITPFTSSFEVDYPTLRSLVSWYVEEKVDGIVVCGTTGEAPTLTMEEQLAVIKAVVVEIKGRIPVIAGTGSNDTRKTVKMTESAAKLGVDGCLVIVPYYNRPTPEGCLAHYSEIAKTGLPIVLYHHPGRTGIKFTIDTIQRIASLPEVVAIKDASGDFELIEQMILQTGKPVLSSDDMWTLPMMKLGSTGAFSVASNVVPQVVKEMVDLAMQKNFFRADELCSRYAKLFEALVCEVNPQCVKYALSLMGKCPPHLRLPLVEPTDESKLKVQEVMTSYGFSFRSQMVGSGLRV